MIHSEEFAMLRKQLQESDRLYEDVFRQSREIVKLSKKIIYNVHRNDLKSASAVIKEMTSKIKKLRQNTRREFLPQLKIAEQEFVEAVCFYEFVRNGAIPGTAKLGVQPEHYLLGLCDLSGELVRKGINAAIQSDDKTALEARQFMELLYDELMQFDFRNGELRRKFDGIKYDLKKLEDVALHIKRK